MADHKKDYTKIGRNLKESQKQNGHMKKGRTLSEEEIQKVIDGYNKDWANGLMDLVKKGHFTQIIKYLYDPYLQPKERICIKFQKIDENNITGVLRDKQIIDITYIPANNEKHQFFVYMNRQQMFSAARQYQVIEWIKHYIGDN